MSKLQVLHDDNTVFIDQTLNSFDYGRDDYSLELIAAEDFLYIGLYKPFAQIYVELKTDNTNANVFDAEFFDGTNFVNIDDTFFDDTRGFTRSGFMTFDRNQEDWALTSVDGIEAFWIRLKPSVDHSVGTEIQGINIVFSDDQDLVEEYRNINQFRPSSDLSFILTHLAMRKKIIQMLRNSGKHKKIFLNNNNPSSIPSQLDLIELRDVTEWDLLDPSQLREASKLYVLASIFFNRSDNPTDKYYQLYKDFRDRAKESYELFFLSLDKDDDGLQDSDEDLILNAPRLFR